MRLKAQSKLPRLETPSWHPPTSQMLQPFGHLDAKSRLIGKSPDAGRDWRQEEKGVAEDEWLDGITGISANSLRCWRTGKPGVSQRVRQDWDTEQQQRLISYKGWKWAVMATRTRIHREMKVREFLIINSKPEFRLAVFLVSESLPRRDLSPFIVWGLCFFEPLCLHSLKVFFH